MIFLGAGSSRGDVEAGAVTEGWNLGGVIARVMGCGIADLDLEGLWCGVVGLEMAFVGDLYALRTGDRGILVGDSLPRMLLAGEWTGSEGWLPWTDRGRGMVFLGDGCW